MQKKLDTVAMMREIRDAMSKEIMNMTFEEEKAYLKKLLSTTQTSNTKPKQANHTF
jgi:hypothetical protein